MNKQKSNGSIMHVILEVIALHNVHMQTEHVVLFVFGRVLGDRFKQMNK